MSEHTISTTDSAFEKDVLQGSLPVLVDFWAPWCGPCKAIAPMLDEVAREYQGRLVIAKMNIDENPDTPSAHNVFAIPTLILFKEGKEVGRKVAALTKSDLVQFLDPHLG